MIGDTEQREIVYPLWWITPSGEGGRPVVKEYGKWTDAGEASEEYERAKKRHPDAEFVPRVGYSAPRYDDPHEDPEFVSLEEAQEA